MQTHKDPFRGLCIGVDCQDIKVFSEIDPKTNREFYSRIFTQREIDYCTSRALPSQHFAARFAAKEAVVKALAPDHVRFKQVEILNHKNGEPYIKLENSQLRKKFFLRVSLSHSRLTAVAFVLGHKKERGGR